VQVIGKKTSAFHTSATMLRQTVSATSRALRSTARLGTQRSIARPHQLHHSQTPLITSARTLAPRIRWYSSETEASKDKDAPESSQNGEESGKTEPESPEVALKKQLEAKDAEIRDLKVSITVRILHSPIARSLTERNRTGTSAP
jgi:molecular chaperone GrpE